jgi:hypothetical protein
MPHRDSIDKVVEVYLAGLCREPFEYKDHKFSPRPVRVSPLIFRGFTCPRGCGGCCPRFSLDYLPTENCPPEATEREVLINGLKARIRSDLQENNKKHFCRNLDLRSGRCRIYEYRPFTCDFELIRIITPKTGPVHLTQKLFGRGWAMQRVDGSRGAKCDMLAPSRSSQSEVVRKLERLAVWAKYFRIKTCIDDIVAWARTGPHSSALFLP